MKERPDVSVLVGDMQTPEDFTKEQLKEMAKDESKAIVFISNVFTTEYKSTIVIGKAILIQDEDERIIIIL